MGWKEKTAVLRQNYGIKRETKNRTTIYFLTAEGNQQLLKKTEGGEAEKRPACLLYPLRASFRLESFGW